MIESIQLLRNVGPFDSVNGANFTFERVTLVFAENGRGKTTISSVFTSLATDTPEIVTNRARLGANFPPHVVVSGEAGQQFQFQNGVWDTSLPDLRIFDDQFVADNVCSGIEIATGQKRALHELILGSQGVGLHTNVQEKIARIKEHNSQIKILQANLGEAQEYDLSADQFCDLGAIEQVALQIVDRDRAVALSRASDKIMAADNFSDIYVPEFDLGAIESLLSTTVENLSATAAAAVEAHLAAVGEQSEEWISRGVKMASEKGLPLREQGCPFCAQELQNSDLVMHFQAYFSEAYEELKATISETQSSFSEAFGGDGLVLIEQSLSTLVQQASFWKDFLEVPDAMPDSSALIDDMKTARDLLGQFLSEKQSKPLDDLKLPDTVIEAVNAYGARRADFVALCAQFVALNPAVAVAKEAAENADTEALEMALKRLRAVEARFTVPVAAKCDAYKAEQEAKRVTEVERDAARAQLDGYRTQVFPAYEERINYYLGRLGTGFRLGNVRPKNDASGSSANYSVVLDGHDVPLNAKEGPCFRNTLSAGDRNSLALAFFFAKIDVEGEIENKVVLIDDPMTSLDEHRQLATVREIIRLAQSASQVFVLSHSKPFLCEIWIQAERNARAAFIIQRAQVGSTIEDWNPNQDSLTEHDKRFARVGSYVVQASPAIERQVASDLRPLLEKFLRVSYSMHFAPGQLLGPFIGGCRQRIIDGNPILQLAHLDELEELKNYANRFHHDSNPAYQNENINDQELLHYSERTLRFLRKA